jgi:Fur family ferric uptake transcriptional regulator
MNDRCDFPQLLALHGLRATAARLEVLETLGAASGALRAQEILARLRAWRRVNKVTIYRILEDFARRGLIRKLPLEGRAAHWELACEHHPPHPHFHCHTCGEVLCLEPVSLERVWPELKGPLGNQAERLLIQVEGICRKCREMEGKP